MIKITNYNKAVLELTLAGIIWGGSFTLVRWALEDFSSTTLLFWRFVIAFILGEVVYRFLNKKDFQASNSDIKLALMAGLFLGGSLVLQTTGLKYTTATNSGFITSLYVVLIPILATLFFKHKLKTAHILLSLMAFIGMGFLLNLSDISLAKGEILTLGAAFTAAFQIMFVGKTAKEAKSPFRFNTYQTFWSLIILLPFLFYEMHFQNVQIWPHEVHFKSVASIFGLALSVSIFAFYLQVRAQRVLSTTTSSMLCLLEGPFAFFFGALFLQERLNLTQGLGALIILGSCVLSIIFDRPQN